MSDIEILARLVEAVKGRIIIEDGIVTGIDCSWSVVTDESLISFPSIPSLEYIDLQKTAITDRGLRCLSKYPSLVDLFLSETSVSGKEKGTFMIIEEDNHECPLFFRLFLRCWDDLGPLAIPEGNGIHLIESTR